MSFHEYLLLMWSKMQALLGAFLLVFALGLSSSIFIFDFKDGSLELMYLEKIFDFSLTTLLVAGTALVFGFFRSREIEHERRSRHVDKALDEFLTMYADLKLARRKLRFYVGTDKEEVAFVGSSAIESIELLQNVRLQFEVSSKLFGTGDKFLPLEKSKVVSEHLRLAADLIRDMADPIKIDERTGRYQLSNSLKDFVRDGELGENQGIRYKFFYHTDIVFEILQESCSAAK